MRQFERGLGSGRAVGVRRWMTCGEHAHTGPVHHINRVRGDHRMHLAKKGIAAVNIGAAPFPAATIAEGSSRPGSVERGADQWPRSDGVDAPARRML